MRNHDYRLSNYQNGPQDEEEFDYYLSALDDNIDDYEDEMYRDIEDVIDDLKEIYDAANTTW
ncbi:MAG: hypothetical protein J6T70_13430 [Bacteroidales bacterium]|nr:hypothetical protein [Bacteroidales bacterium]